MSKWDDHRDDLTSKEDFDKAAKGESDEPAKEEEKSKADVPKQGFTPKHNNLSTPGIGHTSANTRVIDQSQDRSADGVDHRPKDQDNLTDTYNQNANTAWDRQDQNKSNDGPSKGSDGKKK